MTGNRRKFLQQSATISAAAAIGTLGLAPQSSPPIGTACFVVSAIAKVEMRRLFSPMTPFIIVMFATIVLIAYFPWLSLAIPKAVGGYIAAHPI